MSGGEKNSVLVGKEVVELDDSILEFTPETVNEFLGKYSSLYRYFSNKHNNAAYIVKRLTDAYNKLLHAKFKSYKAENSYSDKMAESCAKSDEEVAELQEKLRAAEYAKDELWSFLRSMDYAHSDVRECCFNMRREMDTLVGKSIGAAR